VLHERLADASRSVARTMGPEEPFRSLAPDPLERVSLDALLAAARRGLAAKPDTEVQTDHVASIRASVRDAIETVLALLPESSPVRFRDLTLGVHERLEVIVRFLAVLELFKQGVIDLEQTETFGALIIRPLVAGERVALDIASLEEWGDEETAPAPVEEHA
jgi:segregation and condensation protein A